MKQPKALYLLNFIAMWECFSYYCMRSLLVLFMVTELGYSDRCALTLYAMYITMIEIGGVVGGLVADRLLGLRRSIVVGGWTIVIGHLLLSLPGQPLIFFLGLGSIIAGTSLFRSNLAALLGTFYEEKDPRKEAGYTLYYTGINIGGFLACICCGAVVGTYGWHAGFGVAAFGMIAGNIALLSGASILDQGKIPSTKKNPSSLHLMVALLLLIPIVAMILYCYEVTELILPLILVCVVLYILLETKECSIPDKRAMLSLVPYLMLLALFYSCEEQLGSTLLLFVDRHVDTMTPFGTLPSSSLIMFNPLTILIIGPFLAPYLLRKAFRSEVKIGMGFFLLGIAFLTLYIASYQDVIPLGYAIQTIILIGLAEILITPTIYAKASNAAPRGFEGVVMGIVTLGFAFANLLSGWISQIMVVEREVASLDVYSQGFLLLGGAAMLCGCLVISICSLSLASRLPGDGSNLRIGSTHKGSV